MQPLDESFPVSGSQAGGLQSKHWRWLAASLVAVSFAGPLFAGGGEEEGLFAQEKAVNRSCAGQDSLFGHAVASKRAFLGVELTDLSPELRSHFGVPSEAGVMVKRLVDDSPAFRGGLAVGDIITRVGEQEIQGTWRLTTAIRGHEPGEVVDIEYWRDGEARSATVTLDEREGCVVDISNMVGDLEDLRIHMPEIQAESLRISETAMAEAMEALRDIDWEEQLKDVEALQIDLEMQRQMEEMQIQMQELSERLQLEMEENGLQFREIMKEQEKVFREEHKVRIKAERQARRDLERAREIQRALAEQQREMAEDQRELEVEARAEAQEALQEAHEEMREARQEAHEEMHEAQQEMLEARQEALQEVLEDLQEEREDAAEEGGGVLF